MGIYCVTGRDFFPGAVALLNSLRLLGHAEPFVVCDCGMEARQRELLAPHAEIVPAPRGGPPSLLKFAAPLSRRAEVMILLDADVIVTRPLGELIESASSGSLVAFRNDRDRWFSEWGELLGLGEVPRGPYLTSSALFFGGSAGDRVMALAEERQLAIDADETWLGGGGEERDPLYYLDQDVVNAVARARLRPDEVVAYPARLAPIPPFGGLRLVDAGRLRCAYEDGTEPYLLHHASRKPWLVAMRSNVYSRLLTRLLLADDVALRLPSAELPVRLRTGALAGAARVATDVGIGAPGYARRRLLPRRQRAWTDRR
ncbi:MAG TPA: hypothetical protein VFY99_03300 [Solirubrobacterales bacterium]